MKIIRFDAIEYIPASHENPKDPGAWKKTIIKRGDLVNGRVQMINWAKLPAGRSFEPHYHEDMEEVFIVLEGKAEVIVDKEKAPIEKGDAVIIPIGKVHQMKNIGDSDTYYLVVGISQGKSGKTVIVR